jgi:hypothetical protein
MQNSGIKLHKLQDLIYYADVCIIIIIIIIIISKSKEKIPKIAIKNGQNLPKHRLLYSETEPSTLRP